jgi:gliding motility-associated-like protein
MNWNQGIPGATFTTSGNPPVGRFCWTPTQADLGPNYFVLEVVDNACPIPGRSTRSYTVNVFNSSLSLTTSATPASCPGAANGTASVTVNNGVAPITYSWSTGATTTTISNLLAGDYTVTVLDAGNCPAVRTVTVPEPPPFIVAFDNTTAVCNGDQNGTTLATASGSNGGPFTYSWSNGQTTAFMDSLASGLYFLTVTDADGCVYDTQTFIFQPGPLVILVSASTTSNYNGAAISCNGANDGEITLEVTGGTMPYIYDWSPNANGQTDSIISNLGPGLYSVTLTDANNCNTGTFITIAEPPPVAGSATTLSDISCFGANDGIASATITGGTPGYKYQWGASANNQTTAIATNLVGGFHTVTMSDTNNCSIIDTIEIIEPAQIGIDVRAITDYNGFNITCNGASDGRTKADPIGGTPPFNYQWDAATGGQTTQIAYDVPVGSYSVTITDAGGCTATGSVSLNEPPPLGTATAITSDYNGEDVSCYEAEDGTAETTPFGGVPPYTFFWINVNQVGNAAVDLGANTYYHVTVIDANECEVFDSIILSQPPPVVVTATITSNYNGADISCHQFSDGSAEVINTTGGVPGYTYQWSNNQAGITATGLSATTYTVSATDLNNCVGTTTVTLTDPEPLALAMAVTSDYNGQDISCFGLSDGSVNAAASGGIPGYAYQWDAATNNQTGADALNLPTGTYNVTVTDINSCTFTSSITVTEPPLLAVVATSTDVVCFGNNDGTANAAANGGTPVYTYSWSANPALNNALITGLAQGNYDVTVTDVNNCTATTTFVVNEPPLLVTGMLTDSATCFESFDGFGAVTATGGKGAYTFEWSGDVPTTDSAYSSLYHGTYTVTITDGNGCSSVETLIIGSPPPTSVSVSASETSTYFGDTVQLNAANTSINFPAGMGVEYVWNPTIDLSCFTCPNTLAFPVFTTLYDVTMVDDRGCVATDTITIHINPYDKILYVPNAFSPDGDDNNEIFYVYAAGVKSIDFKIFNRWGEKIFQSNSLDHGWDGIYKNEMMNPSVYVYYVEVTYLDDDIKAKKGSVTLIR